MTELERLKKQRKEINEKIRAIENPYVRVGRAKFYSEKYPRGREWKVGILGISEMAQRHATIIAKYSKHEAIESILEIIGDLQGLYDELRGEE